MHVIRLQDAQPYDAPGHDDMACLRLQGKDLTPLKTMWAANLQLLPGARTTPKSSDEEKIYVVLSGEVTVSDGTQSDVLKAWDSCAFSSGESREIFNHTNCPAVICLVMGANG